MFFYAETPGFYAEVERSRRPELAERPILVGGDPRRSNARVRSASLSARRLGIEEGMPMSEALRRCPEARVLRTDMRFYQAFSSRLQAIFRSGFLRVEPAGPGTAWLSDPLPAAPPEAVAERLRRQVAEAVGLPLVVGAAPVKFLARIAAERLGAAGFCCISAVDMHDFLGPLPVACLPGVGSRTEATLRELGAHCVSDLLRIGRRRLEEALGNHGRTVFGYAEGRDANSVRRARLPGSFSQELTLGRPERDLGVLAGQLRTLAEALERTLQREHCVARRLMLKLRYADDPAPITRSHTTRRPLTGAGRIHELSVSLLARTQAGARSVRGLGLSARGLLHRAPGEPGQPELF